MSWERYQELNNNSDKLDKIKEVLKRRVTITPEYFDPDVEFVKSQVDALESVIKEISEIVNGED